MWQRQRIAGTPFQGLQALCSGDFLASLVGLLLDKATCVEGAAGCPQHAQLLLVAEVEDIPQKLRRKDANISLSVHAWLLVPKVIHRASTRPDLVV